MTTEPTATLALLTELEPVVEANLNRHLATAKEWFPHELVPWSRGRDYADGECWDPETAKLCDGARSALFLNILIPGHLESENAFVES